MQNTRITPALLLCLMLTLQGCASIYTNRHSFYEADEFSCDETHSIPRVYSGTVLDIYNVGAENAGFFVLVDVPFSLILDTVLLPYTAYRQFKDGDWYSREDCLARQIHSRSSPQLAPP